MRNLNRIPLGALRAVEATGRLGSLRAAADELGVTIGAVSQQIQKAERQLDRTLFERRPNGLSPSPTGAEILPRLTAGMRELSAAVALAEHTQENVLTVSAPPVFAGKFLVWRLNHFTETHPDIRIRLEATMVMVDPDTADIDICIRIAREPGPGIHAEKLLEHRVFPVCSPQLASRISQVTDLAQVPVIRDSGALFGWHVWLEPNGLDETILQNGPVYSDASLCLDAAIAGQGVFLAWETLACDALSAGRLVAPLPGRYPTGDIYWFIKAERARKSPAVRDFEIWLRSELDAALAHPARSGA